MSVDISTPCVMNNMAPLSARKKEGCPRQYEHKEKVGRSSTVSLVWGEYLQPGSPQSKLGSESAV
eukprot:scaffold7294_cov93-Cylindrotheca_fusiformis.AAC.3